MEKQFSVFCDLEGHVIQILQDEGSFLPDSLIGNMLFSIVVPGDLDKIINFFLELKSKGTAIGWEINIKTQTGAKTFSFFGGMFDGKLGIAAATTKNGAQLLYTELTKINNEQANIIRALSKDQAKLQTLSNEPDVNYYEELSRLNNDLVNMQRELSKKNRELDELNKLKNQFLGMAAHDLRNPLGVIMGYCEYLIEEMEEEGSTDHATILNSILASSSFMLHLLNDLLDVSAIESGNLNLSLVKTDLIPIVEKNVELNNVIAAKKNITINITQSEPIPEIVFDIGKIEQVLNNLISNAVKFSQRGTSVSIKIIKSNTDVVVSVNDQCQGIPNDELEKLFKPFEKTSVRSTAGEKSTGLGLSIVRKLVLGHKGKIWVESEVGKGSTFYFSLPI
ncbi:MAG: HAMP domain-containing sensor histidine kinase [Ignavibacteria bacterium]|nr:HAMP domain-containing sensor histidine kinase [Ignavibacteria bacterium]